MLKIVWDRYCCLFLSEIDIGGDLNCAKVYSNDHFFGDGASSALNFDKYMLQLQSQQPTIMFHNILKGRQKDYFGQIIAEINILLFLKGSSCIGTPLA